MQTVFLDEMRRTASRLLAAAALEQFPNTILIQGGDTPLGFYYDFEFPFVFKNEFLPLLEEKMRQISKERRSIELLEMVPSNAAEFLLHHGLDRRAEEARSGRHALIEIVRMGAFIDLCQGGAASSSDQAGFFRLQGIQAVESGVRIFGTAFPSQKELKEFLKKVDSHPKMNHQKLGGDLALFSKLDGGWIWHPRGEIFCNLIIQLWKEEHLNQKFHIIHSFPHPPEITHRHYLHACKASKVAEFYYKQWEEPKESFNGLFDTTPFRGDEAHLSCLSWELESQVISSLQFIVKFSKIFDFEPEVFQCLSLKKKNDERLALLLRGFEEPVNRERSSEERGKYPTLEIRVKDALGRQWSIASLQVDFDKEVIIRSSCVSLERLVALLLERHQGELPFWIAPEQMRVIAIAESLTEKAGHLKEHLQSEGFRVGLDCSNEKLSKRMHQTLQDKVPYSVFLGEREMKANKVTLKVNSSGQEELLSLEELVQRLNMMNRKRKLEN